MDAMAWQRRRRATLALAVVLWLLAIAAALATWILAPGWRSSIVGVWAIVAVLQLLLLARRRPRTLLRRLRAVEEVVGDDGVAMTVGLDEGQATGWLGPRAWATPYLVLVDDPDGLALWDVRRGLPVEVVRVPWSAIADAVVREGGARVDLDPAAPGDPALRLVPTGFREEPPQLMQTPSRSLAFAARIRERLHAFDPVAHPSRPRPSEDIDWTGLSTP